MEKTLLKIRAVREFKKWYQLRCHIDCLFTVLIMLDSLKKIDAFPKAFDDFRVKTTTGALG